MVYPALLPLMRTPRLPVVDWTDAPCDVNDLVRFVERRNLVSACVPPHFKRSLPPIAWHSLVPQLYIPHSGEGIIVHQPSVSSTKQFDTNWMSYEGGEGGGRCSKHTACIPDLSSCDILIFKLLKEIRQTHMHEAVARWSEQQLREFCANGIRSMVQLWVSCLLAVVIFL